MSDPKLPSYVLQEQTNITESINYPIKNVQRVKYTCFDVSKSLIVFGATSGGIYVFNRSPCEFLQLIPNKDGAITKISISPDEKHIGFSNGRGVVTVTKCEQALSGGHSTVTSKEHLGNEVTCLVWSGHGLFIGDDVGKVSVLQLKGFISSAQTIMSLDSRICQLDVKSCMLLVATLSRCYICDTAQEQYRQIGQKPRDGEFGACFLNHDKCRPNGAHEPLPQFTETKKYDIVDDDAKFAVGKDLENTLIYCARPSSRLWEASIHGIVERTHQFKRVLAKESMNVVTLEKYNKEEIDIKSLVKENEGQSVNFPKIFNLNGSIFAFRKEGLYFLNIHNEDDTLWCNIYKDISDCKLYHDNLYLWLNDGSMIHLRFMKIDKFLVKCYIEEKYLICAELCALYRDYLLNNNLTTKIHILLGLRDKLPEELLLNIESVLDKLESLKSIEATQLKSGIYVLDNTYNAQTSLDENQDSNHEEIKYGQLETLQTLKDLSASVTDKITSSTKILKEKWDDFEGKMKHHDKQYPIQEYSLPDIVKDQILDKPANYDDDIIYKKESSQKAIEIKPNIETTKEDQTCKILCEYYRLSQIGNEERNLITIIESYSSDIKEIYTLMIYLENHVARNFEKESNYIPSYIFLNYLNSSTRKSDLLDEIIKDENIYEYFVNSCINVNIKLQNITNQVCECGFPLPRTENNIKPRYSELIDEFIEKQWSNQTKDQCYEVCRRMPYLWRKILYLRRNDDLLNILQIILQILDENLLHSFLPQFTLATWDKAIQLYAVLHGNVCLNCYKKFYHISVKETLSWDDIGRLLIKSVGGKNAIKVIEKHAALIEPGDLTMRFYHTCLLVTMYEKYDATITNQLTDALYNAYEFEDSRVEICNLLRTATDGRVKNTSLPIVIAGNTVNWGLQPLTQALTLDPNDIEELLRKNLTLEQTVHSEKEQREKVIRIKYMNLKEIVENLSLISKEVLDCTLCGLPLQNQVLIKDGGLWVFKCGHIFHGACLSLNRVKLCASCSVKV